ncbi:MAG: serine/threonine protein phosphatase [Flavobacteriaceae bacterium]|nr:serine/threonine protein phosphatase [Bacteroidia bacterium]NNL15914.1 serine/threonine protein phosphatase [Flavobacteriaceae bacterium]
MRTLVVGDIHGGLKALVQLLERANVAPEDTLVFVGDYVDGWSESSFVLRYLIELSNTNNCIFIKGNHDVWCERWLKDGSTNDTWLYHGGKETIASYTTISDDEKQLHLKFLRSMKLYHIDDKNRLFVHAGFVSMHGPHREYSETNLYYDRTLWEMALTMDKRIQMDSILYPKRLKLFNEIYIGHTPTIHFDSFKPMNAINVWNVDTGACFYGKLSCLDVDTKEIFQSDVVQSLYPYEKGRNK